MLRRVPLILLLVCICNGGLHAQDLSGIEIHGFVTQGFLFSSHNNYLTMETSSGSLQWTDGAISFNDSLSSKLRVGIQLHMYQLGQLGGPNIHVDWASGDYRVNDHLGFRAGKVKTVLGLFNDSQDVDPVYLWILLPQGAYPIDNQSVLLAHLGGEVYGGVPLGERSGTLLYRACGGYNSLDLNGGYAQQLASAGLVFTTPPGGTTYGGDLRWEAPLTGLTLGSSGVVQGLDGTAPAGSVHVNPFLLDAEYAQFSRGKFYFAGEYRREPAGAIFTIAGNSFPVPADRRTWFAMASYRPLKKLNVGTYYSHYVNKALDTSVPANYSKDWAVSGRYDFDSYFYAKLESHVLHGTGLGYYINTNPNGLKPNSNMLAAKIGFSF
jgi:hypothetical protein